jgi:hypothetical protein
MDGAAAFATDAAVVTLPVSDPAPLFSSFLSSLLFSGAVKTEPHLMQYFLVSWLTLPHFGQTRTAIHPQAQFHIRLGGALI